MRSDRGPHTLPRLAVLLTSACFVCSSSTAYSHSVNDHAAVLLVCQAMTETTEYLIELDKPTNLGMMNCVWGLVDDLTPCSINGHWALSYPTGSAGIATATPTWREAYDHTGGKFWTNLKPLAFEVKVGFGEGLPQDVAVSIDRTSGSGQVSTISDNVEDIQCQVVERLF